MHLRGLLALALVGGCTGPTVIVPGNAIVVTDTAVLDTSPFDTGAPGIPLIVTAVPLRPTPPVSVPPSIRETQGDTDEDLVGISPHEDPCPPRAFPWRPDEGPPGPCTTRVDRVPPPNQPGR